jgi:DNA-binding MarR family transcriptional regulator
MNDKELLIKAIENYDPYSLSKRKVLKVLVNTSIDGIARISGKRISELVGKSLGNIFLTIRNLEKDGFIERIKSTGEQSFSYKLNPSKMDFIIKLYYHNSEQFKKQ